MEPAIARLWQDFLDSLPATTHRPEKPAQVFSFGDSRAMADQLSLLVRQQIKKATCSALSNYEEDPLSLPQKGDLSIVLGGSGIPVGVIETLEVFVLPYNEVPEWFAYEEGEGDRSLTYWRKAHRDFFTRNSLKNPFDERTLLVCQRFRLVYTDPASI
jgi:uncharacterized protein YhfF